MIKVVVNAAADRGEWHPWRKNEDGSVVRYRVRIIPPKAEKDIHKAATQGLTGDKWESATMTERSSRGEKLILFRAQYAVTEIDGLRLDLGGDGPAEQAYAKAQWPECVFENGVATIKEGALSDTTKANLFEVVPELFADALKVANELRGVASLEEAQLGKT